MSNPIVHFAFTVEYVFRCQHRTCSVEARRSYPHQRGEELMLANAPAGWTIINGWTFCPAHKISIKIETEGEDTHYVGVCPEFAWL